MRDEEGSSENFMLDKLHQAVPSGFFFRYDNHRGAQYAVGQGVAFFHDADDGVRLLLADDRLHRLMLVRVEFVAGLGVDFFDMRSVKRFLQFVQRHLHAEREKLGNSGLGNGVAMPKASELKHPVTNVSWFAANAYCLQSSFFATTTIAGRKTRSDNV